MTVIPTNAVCKTESRFPSEMILPNIGVGDKRA